VCLGRFRPWRVSFGYASNRWKVVALYSTRAWSGQEKWA
jgi:hypothetical protein